MWNAELANSWISNTCKIHFTNLNLMVLLNFIYILISVLLIFCFNSSVNSTYSEFQCMNWINVIFAHRARVSPFQILSPLRGLLWRHLDCDYISFKLVTTSLCFCFCQLSHSKNSQHEAYNHKSSRLLNSVRPVRWSEK